MDLIIVEYRDKRVLTTAQLADSYGTDKQLITNNFNRNKDRYKEGKHFIALKGQEKNEFIDRHQIDLSSKNAQILYLWTEKGAWLHAKSLNTDEAWDAYELLVDEYYKMTEQQKVNFTMPQPTQAEIIAMIAQQGVEQERRLNAVEQRTAQLEKQQENITETVLLSIDGWKDKVSAILNRIAIARGGGDQFRKVRSESYEVLEKRGKCRLNIRLENLKKEAQARGICSPSKIRNFNKIDVIDADARLTEIYLAIVKEMAIAHKVNAEGLGA